MDNDTAVLQQMLPGSLLQLIDDSFAIVPMRRATVTRSGQPLKASVVAVVDGPATEQSEVWLNANVRNIYMGVLTVGARGGSKAATIVVHGLRTVVEVASDPADDTATDITHLKLTTQGAAATLVPMAAGLTTLGLVPTAWAGGQGPVVLRVGHGLPGIATLASATTPADHFAGSGAGSSLKLAKLQLLGLPTGATVSVEMGAKLITGLTEQQSLSTALALVLATPSPPPSPCRQQMPSYRHKLSCARHWVPFWTRSRTRCTRQLAQSCRRWPLEA